MTPDKTRDFPKPLFKDKSEFKIPTIRDVQKLASGYKEDFNIGPHSIWLKSGETSIGIFGDLISVVDCEGNETEVPLNEIIAYILMNGSPSEGE